MLSNSIMTDQMNLSRLRGMTSAAKEGEEEEIKGEDLQE